MAALTIEFPQTVWTVEFGGDEIVVAEVTMTGGTGGGGTFDGVHNDLDGRSTADAHPISAITGLTAALEAGGASALADLTDVDVETDPPAPDDVLAWDGTNWTPATLDAGSGLELGETSSTAYRGDRGKTAYDHSQVVTGNPHGTTAGDIGAVFDPGGVNDDFLQRKSGDWTNRTPAQVKADLGVTETLIASTTLGAAAASISFTSIPGTYTHLKVVFVLRGDTAGVDSRPVRLRLNNDSGSNYNYQTVGGSNTSAACYSGTAQSSVLLGYMPAATATANYASAGSILIPFYKATTFFKMGHAEISRDTNAAVVNMYNIRNAFVWRSTSAITGLDLLPQTDNFLAGSTAYLYGVN